MNVNKPSFTREPNRASTRNGSNGRYGGKFNGDATWSAVDCEELGHFVQRVTDLGACVLFTKSSDGGVLSITVIFGGDRLRAYPRSADDALVVMHDLLDTLGG